MKRILAAIALACAAVLPAACGPRAESPAAADTLSPSADAVAPAPDAPAATAAAPAGPAASESGERAAPGAPAFAAVYPGGALEAPAVTATGPTGPGGLATYTTEADPDTVIAFHRARAEAAGLTTSMAMNQGEARAYGATRADSGANLQVVASATDDGPTSVQISWSSGQ